MRIRVFQTPHDAGIYTAALTERTILENAAPVLGLATGGTPVPFYEALVDLHRCGLDFSHVKTFNLDEYIGLSADHEQSYHKYMYRHLFSQVNIHDDQIHIPNGCQENLEEECEKYDRLIRRSPIDLQILGIGVNGHIGFNEPNHLLMSRTHVVELRDETVRSNARFFTNIEEVPRQAITMGVQAILQAKQIVLMAFGEEKAEIIAKAAYGEVRTDVPASILQLHRDVTLVLDSASAKALPWPLQNF